MRVATPASLRIRQRRSADDSFIARLATLAFGEYDLDAAATLRRLVQRGTTWVALRGDTPVGFVVVQPLTESSVDVCAIAVDEDERGRGIGRSLLAHVERAALGAGLKEVHLHTAQANMSALELFLRGGFRVTARMPRFYRGMYDACALVKRIGSTRH